MEDYQFQANCEHFRRLANINHVFSNDRKRRSLELGLELLKNTLLLAPELRASESVLHDARTADHVL